MKNKIISLILILSVILFNPIAVAAANKSITLDEATFNNLVNRAKEADILEKEVLFYKEKYEMAVNKSQELTKLHREGEFVKDDIIKQQKNLVEINMERLKVKDGIISLQDKKISKLERTNMFRNVLLLGLTAAGVAVASNNSDTGAAVGIGAAGILTFLIK